ncbi:MAG: NAD(P)/FAD-dependent oxidoreductase [Candidatus Aenigmarchaeota archaeon]|nr:NAD(P)/FAD-dependent oxidoreductase [Candidatus Aenigmarchaeota archaeon]
MHDVVIVGGGPSGCEVARLVSEEGYDALVIEEHSKIGIPTQCAGLVSFRIGGIPEKLILNRIKVAKFCCRNEYFEVKSRIPMFVIDRKGYDVFVAERAISAGAKLKMGIRFLNFKNGKVVTNRGNYQTKILIGADGPNSSVAKVAGIKLPKNLLKAVQAHMKSNFEPNVVELWFGSDTAPGNFAWVVPENEEEARVGLMMDDNPSPYFEKILKKRFGNSKTRNRIGGVIRYGLIEKSVANNILLVGDAAAMVKPFSLGGLVYGQIGSEFAGRACIKALEQEDFSKKFFLKNYDFLWKEKLKFPIMKGLLLKKNFSIFQDTPAFFKIIRECGIAKLALFLDVDLL